MKNDYSLVGVLKTLARWKKQIFITTIIVAVISIIGSLLMPTYYKSTTILYAASPTLANPDPVGGTDKSYYIYGTGEDLDRLFSIANSSEIKWHIINKYNLAEHYKIKTNTAKGKAKLAKKFNKLYITNKTKYDAMELSIEDTNPELARDMVREAREMVEKRAQDLIKESQANLISVLESSIDIQEKSLSSLSDTLTKLKQQYDIYDSYAQAGVLAEIVSETDANLAGEEAMLSAMKQYGMPRDTIQKVQAKVEGTKSRQESLQKRVADFNEGVLSIRSLEVEQSRILSEVTFEKERLKKLMASYNQQFSAMHIVEKEDIPNDKSRPRRSLIVIGFTLLGFVLSCLGVLLIENTKEINWKEVYAGK